MVPSYCGNTAEGKPFCDGGPGFEMKRDLQVGIAQWLPAPGEPKRNHRVALDMIDLADLSLRSEDENRSTSRLKIMAVNVFVFALGCGAAAGWSGTCAIGRCGASV